MKPRILFVDDEPNVLSGLRRMLHGKREEWDTGFINSAEQALEALDRVPIDVVVSDMRMPGMNGAELLAEVRRRSPGTVRIILSGFADKELVFRTAGPAHQFLSKPCESQTIINAIARAIDLRKLLKSDPLSTLLAGLSDLPSPPSIYFELLDELASPMADADSVGAIIGRDVAMTAQILRICNSAFFALRTKAIAPRDAVIMLGFDTVRDLVLCAGMFRQFQGGPGQNEAVEALSAHSLAVAAVAREIGAAMNFERLTIDEIFCAAVLANIGCLILLAERPADYRKVMAMVETSDCRVDEAETEIFGVNHWLLGAYLVGLWGFNDSVVEAVAFCPNPGQAVNRRPGVLTAVHAAEGFVSAWLRHHNKAHDLFGRLDPDHDYLAAMGVADKREDWCAITEKIMAPEAKAD